jgi:hypothetical protein
MISSTHSGWRTITIAIATAVVAACQQQPASQSPAAGTAPAATTDKQRMTNLGIEHKTARGLYDHLKQQAQGGKALSWETVPDWTGVWTREASPFFWDPDQASPTALPTAKLTPEYNKRLMEKLDKINRGIEFDPLSNCEPAGMPRWMVEPFLREWVVTPQETYLVNEMQNEMRRVYTDGRDHPSAEDAYPLWEGDSIGFWDGNKLVIHTAQMRAGQYQRIQPDYTEQVETVEIWQKTDDSTMAVDVWSFDPPALAEPWYTKQIYKRLSNDDKSLRIRYWDCGENQNNTVKKTDTGSSDFTNFDFTKKDGK